jgi:4-azaleucine resistance transporter AzlC
VSAQVVPGPAACPSAAGGTIFTWHGVAVGARLAAPLALGSIPYGLAYGVLSGQSGLSPVEVLLMSGLVCAGTAQFVVLGLWSTPLPVGLILLTTLVINARFLLMGTTLQAWFAPLPGWQRYSALFVLSDESWARAMSERARGGRDAAVLLGAGGVLAIEWVGSTTIGRLLSGHVGDPTRLGLDVAFGTVFAALLVGMWRGRSDLFPWTVAAVVALAAHAWLPGAWYILLGGLAGGAAGAMRDAR